MAAKKKRPRHCKRCGLQGHDSRNCQFALSKMEIWKKQEALKVFKRKRLNIIREIMKAKECKTFEEYEKEMGDAL